MQRWGSEIMHQKLTPVSSFDTALVELINNMFATMYAADGVGLAANQIGVDLAVFVFDCPDADEINQQGVICNPVLIETAGTEKAAEGCLSYPGAFVDCKRADYAVVTGFDQFGTPVRVSGTGLLARCLQHETDHINGTVFADHLSARLRRKLTKQMEESAAEYPLTWPVP